MSSLYERLGGYEAICAAANDLLPRLMNDDQLGRFWAYRGDDGVAREKQLLIDYLCHVTGGPMYYTGRNMLVTHRGMGITESDWDVFLSHAQAMLASLGVGEPEATEVATFVASLKTDIVDP